MYPASAMGPATPYNYLNIISKLDLPTPSFSPMMSSLMASTVEYQNLLLLNQASAALRPLNNTPHNFNTFPTKDPKSSPRNVHQSQLHTEQQPYLSHHSQPQSSVSELPHFHFQSSPSQVARASPKTDFSMAAILGGQENKTTSTEFTTNPHDRTEYQHFPSHSQLSFLSRIGESTSPLSSSVSPGSASGSGSMSGSVDQTIPSSQSSDLSSIPMTSLSCCMTSTITPSFSSTLVNDNDFANFPRKQRTVYHQFQVRKLEEAFHKQQYMVGSDRAALAQQLGLTETQVRVWFQNRRSKWRKELREPKTSSN